jgi:outer membrane protein assembly factor BamB
LRKTQKLCPSWAGRLNLRRVSARESWGARPRSAPARQSIVWLAILVVAATAIGRAEDWPEIRGKGRLGVWNETGIVERFPADGLKVLWRTPVAQGYAGPAVSEGRVFVVDYTEKRRLAGTERAVALDEKTGTILWTHEWPVEYAGIMWPHGPRTTPTVDGDRVYVLGATGRLFCLNAKTGEVIWQKNYVSDYGAAPKSWAYDYGFSSAPLVDGDRVICMVGGKPDALVVAFDKRTGKEVWRALSSDSDLGVAQPIIITAGRARQLIIWHPMAIASLDPATGRAHWELPYKTGGSMTVATPVQSGSHLLFSSFYSGSLMLVLDGQKPAARVLWQGGSQSEIQTDGLHSTIATPAIVGDHIYGICSYGQLRCLLAKSGGRVWETQALTKERSRWAAGLIVRNGDRLFINNDRGELIIMNPSPAGYQEISRTHLIKPTTPPGNRRELEYVNWSHPAYANKHIYARNDEEIICASLATDGT